jgi:hypothetical protein
MPRGDGIAVLQEMKNAGSHDAARPAGRRRRGEHLLQAIRLGAGGVVGQPRGLRLCPRGSRGVACSAVAQRCEIAGDSASPASGNCSANGWKPCVVILAAVVDEDALLESSSRRGRRSHQRVAPQLLVNCVGEVYSGRHRYEHRVARETMEVNSILNRREIDVVRELPSQSRYRRTAWRRRGHGEAPSPHDLYEASRRRRTALFATLNDKASSDPRSAYELSGFSC